MPVTRSRTNYKKRSENNALAKEAQTSFDDQFKSERDLYDERLAVLRREMNKIQTRRNMSTLINLKLPAEVLSNIFYHTKLCYRSPEEEGRSYSSGWISCVSHVCRHWRSIVLSNSSLWTDGIPKNVDAFQTFMNRSRDLPIVLDENITSLLPRRQELVPLVLSQMRRVRELYIYVPGGTPETSVILKVLDVDMPLLKVFHLKLDMPWHLDTIPSITLPRPTILQHVRELDMSYCGLDWNEAGMNNLTTLCLSGCRSSWHFNPSVRQILDVLKRSPRLRILHLSSVIGNGLDDPEVPSLNFSLPHLEHLALATHATRFAKAFVSPDVLPELDSIEIEIFTPDEQTMMDIFLSAARLKKKKTVSVISTIGNGTRQDGMFSYLHDSDEDESFTFDNMWEISDASPINLHQALLSCLEEFDTQKLTKFEYALSLPLPEQWCRDIFSRLPALEVLRIDCSDEDPSGLISALTPIDTEDVAGTPQTFKRNRMHSVTATSTLCGECHPSLLLPSLRQLVFAEVKFNASTSRRRASRAGGASYTKGSFKHLAHCIELRKQCGSNLDLLAIPCTSEEFEKTGANLRQNVSVLACLYDENVDETGTGFPQVVVQGSKSSAFSDQASDYEIGSARSTF